MHIRHAETKDLPTLLKIRNYYIINSDALFETKSETVELRLPWFEKDSNNGPCRLLVAIEKEQILGCAYSSKYRDGEWFTNTAETRIFQLFQKTWPALFRLTKNFRKLCLNVNSRQS
jgi:L-amino acid N-acyltransferase YncA